MQKRIALLFALALFATGTAYAQAYKWIDKDGTVHYSDRPEPGAERVDLSQSRAPRPDRARTQTVVKPDAARSAAAEQNKPFRYESLSVASPASEETLWNIEGELNVTLALTPALQPGHQVRVYFDGNPRPVAGTSFQLTEVYRGEHNLQAEILDASGTLMIRSVPSRFYVQQNTVF